MSPRFAASLRCFSVCLAVLAAFGLASCGGGGEVAVAESPPPIAALSVRVAQTGPETIQVDWSDDPDVHQFAVQRNADVFANLMTTTLIDTAASTGVQYCYQVSGYAINGDLIAASNTLCIVPV